MSENLIEQKDEPQKEANKRPQNLPDKYWDNKNQTVKLDDLIADFNNMSVRDENLVETGLRGIPESYDKYELNIPSPYLERDEDVLKRMYDKHFTNEQAQLVYDLANERVIPVLSELTINFDAQKQLEKLVRHFGSQERFNEVARQISTWAKQNLRPEIYDALATTSEGVLALYQMMSSPEPILARDAGTTEELSETSLRKMMEDPRYWRDKDASYVAKITKGFEKLYPEK